MVNVVIRDEGVNGLIKRVMTMDDCDTTTEDNNTTSSDPG